MTLSIVQQGLGIASGSLVGFSLGLVGGGGSILAVPLIVYAVGIADPHVAIGTSAVAVAASALFNLFGHARAGKVKWRCASVFALAGIVGALIGASIGKLLDGQKLLALFALLMLAVATAMLVKRRNAGKEGVRLDRQNLPKLLALGVSTGGLSGFFGIGGGFLIVPGLVAATGMPLLNAVASSLLAVAAFGITTAASYALSGLVDWGLAALLIGGGVAGGIAGAAAGRRLAMRGSALNLLFSGLIFVVAIYVLARSLVA